MRLSSQVTRSAPEATASPLRVDASVPVKDSRVRLAALAVVVGMVPSLTGALSSRSFHPDSYATNTTDALVFRVTAELLIAGKTPYSPEQHADHVARTRLDGPRPENASAPVDGSDAVFVIPFAYPPNGLPLFLTHLAGPPRLAYVLNALAGTGLLLIATWLLSARLGLPPGMCAAVTVAVGFGGAVLFNVLLGQTGNLVAACALAYGAWMTGRPRAAGIALGLMAFKPQYALVFGLIVVLQRRWRIAAWSLATFAAMTVLSAGLFGWGMWTDFLGAVAATNPTRTHMCNWFALANAFGQPSWVELFKWPVMLAGLVGIGFIALRSHRGAGAPEDQALNLTALAAAMAPLVSPNTHPYDLSLLLLSLMVWGRHRGPLTMIASVAGFGIAVRLLQPPPLRWVIPLLNVVVVGLIARRVFASPSQVSIPARTPKVQQQFPLG